MNNVEQYLKDNEIEYVLHKHKAVFTCEDVDKYCKDIKGISCKNLFLRDQKKRRYFLFILKSDQRANLKELGNIVGEKLSFASPKDLESKMRLLPGSVSPFGLLNDKDNKIEVFITEDINKANIVNFHPNVNTATVELTGDMFGKYLATLRNSVKIVSLS